VACLLRAVLIFKIKSESRGPLKKAAGANRGRVNPFYIRIGVVSRDQMVYQISWNKIEGTEKRVQIKPTSKNGAASNSIFNIMPPIYTILSFSHCSRYPAPQHCGEPKQTKPSDRPEKRAVQMQALSAPTPSFPINYRTPPSPRPP
jgi:hypothetical protein